MAAMAAAANQNGNSSAAIVAVATSAGASTTVQKSDVSIEDLYKYFGILADANDQAGLVIYLF